MSKEKISMKDAMNRTKCPIFGSHHELYDRMLATILDVLKYYLFVKCKIKATQLVRADRG